MIKLDNALVEVRRDEFALDIVFAANGTRVVLQRALDPRDGEPGLDGVYLEVGEQEFVAYGAVEKVKVTRQSCWILINSPEKFDGSSEVLVSYGLAAGQYEALCDAVGFIFADCDWALSVE